MLDVDAWFRWQDEAFTLFLISERALHYNLSSLGDLWIARAILYCFYLHRYKDALNMFEAVMLMSNGGGAASNNNIALALYLMTAWEVGQKIAKAQQQKDQLQAPWSPRRPQGQHQGGIMVTDQGSNTEAASSTSEEDNDDEEEDGDNDDDDEDDKEQSAISSTARKNGGIKAGGGRGVGSEEQNEWALYMIESGGSLKLDKVCMKNVVAVSAI
jgi:hypothetical protein